MKTAKTLLREAVLIVSLFLCPAVLLGQQYWVSGNVTTSDGVTPYGIVIQMHRVGQTEGPVPLAYTMSDGTYAIQVPAGTYKIYADSSYCIYPPTDAYVMYRPEWYPGVLFYNNATSVEVGPGHTTTHINFTLSRYAEISGTVRDASTQTPIAGVEVSAQSTGTSEIGGVLRSVTDELGAYTLYVNAGDWWVRADPGDLPFAARFYDDQVNQADADVLSVDMEGVWADIDFSLPPIVHGGISGHVFHPDGAPLPGAWVNISGFDPYHTAAAMTDANGYYEFTTLPQNQYRMDASHSQHPYPRQLYCGQYGTHEGHRVQVTPGVMTSNIDFHMEYPGQISGVVTNIHGEPLEGMGMVASQRSGVFEYGVTGSDGSYEISGLPPGYYRVRTQPESWPTTEEMKLYPRIYYPDTEDYYEATAIEIRPGQSVSGIDFGLERGVIISGVVVNATGTQTGHTRIQAIPADADMYSSDGYPHSVVEARFSRFQLIRLKPGPYKLRAERNEQLGLAGSFYHGKHSFEEGEILDLLVTNEVADVEMLVYNEATVSGRILGLHSAGVRYASVYALTTNGYIVGSHSETTWQGNYTIRGLSPGTYVIYAVPAYHNEAYNGSYAAQYLDGTSLANARRIELDSGDDVTGLDITLSTTGGRINGTVTRAADGQPIEYMQIQVWSTDHPIVVMGEAYTAANGTYSVRGLAPGQYHVFARGRRYEGKQAQFYSNQLTRATAHPVTVAAGTVSGIHFAIEEVVPIEYVPFLRQPAGMQKEQPLEFQWTDTYVRWYELEVDDLTAGITGIVRVAGIEGTNYVTSEIFPAGHQLRARVRCGNSAGYGEWSTYVPFSIAVPPQYPLTVNVVGPGSVELDPPGGLYDPDTVVTLTTVEEDGFPFDHWVGVDSNLIAPVAVVTMHTERVVSAVFLSNRAPDAPLCLSPMEGAKASIQPVLRSSAFSDPDVEDTHTASHWQIGDTEIGFAPPLYDTQTGPVIEHRVPPGVLVYTSYVWRVRHKDDHDNWSPWSMHTTFDTTLTLDDVFATSEGEIELAWPTLPGYLYTLYICQDLLDEDCWEPVEGYVDVPGDGEAIHFQLPSEEGLPGFFRVGVIPIP